MFGALIGDLVGSIYEFNNYRKKDFPLINEASYLTDDSIMTLAVCDCIQKGYVNDKELIIDNLKRWGRAYPGRGYGSYFRYWLNSDIRDAYNSFGNGAAMRISAAGWYGRNEEEVKDLSKRLTEVTHNHEEGLKGALVVAMCVYYAKIGKDKVFIQNYVSNYYDINFNFKELQANNVFNETCQNTVPQAIYCFLISKDFEDCLRNAIAIGGDSDTIACISCSIAEAHYQELNKELIMEVLKKLPESKDGCDPKGVITQFIKDGASKKFF